MVLSSQANGIQFHHLHHHHATCQRHQKSKFIATPVVNESMYLLFCSIEIWFLKVVFIDDQQNDFCDRSFSSSSAGGNGGSAHYCTHSSNDSTRPLITSIPHQQTNDDNTENFKLSAPPSTGSSSHSSSGIGSTIESPYNHWKYLTPLTVATNDKNHSMSDNKILSSTTNEQSVTTN